MTDPMTDPNDEDRVPASAYMGRVGRGPADEAPRAPVTGMTGMGAFACLLGVVALVFAAVGLIPLLTTTIAFISLVCGLGVFLPRTSTVDKILFTVGVLTSLVALVILLLRLTS
jgi:hypothetical protein